MPDLTPYPFEHLLRRVFCEFRSAGRIFNLPAAKFWRGPTGQTREMGVWFHRQPAGSPLGPAAGPHTQMAQNIVLAWLGGSRLIELKTIQVNDELAIPRPCIDAANVGYNVEFSQELRLEQSLEEYVKAWMLIRLLEETELLGVSRRRGPTPPGASPSFYDCVFDLSIGYTLNGIRSNKVGAVVRGLVDATATIERLRRQIPDEFAALRKVDFSPRIVSTASLSTFHGCPPHEIEGIVESLLGEYGLHCVVKMNPTMLGRDRLCQLLNETLGYHDITVNPSALDAGLGFAESVALLRRLRVRAEALGLEVGAKFTNTLEVLNHRHVFPASEKVMYMSGTPLHPIAFELALKFREAYALSAGQGGDQAVTTSFSGGVDRLNFGDCVASGFVPVTVCTDLLKPGGYGRQVEYLERLEADMEARGTRSISDYVVQRAGVRDLEEAALQNHRHIWKGVVSDTRYTRERNSLVPKRLRSRLVLFDCITCDKCVAVCPNGANFAYETPQVQVSFRSFHLESGRVTYTAQECLSLKKAHQIANFADFCNQCGNCDTFCPENGGPFLEKPSFFLSRDRWLESGPRNAFYISRDFDGEQIVGRIDGCEFALRRPRQKGTEAPVVDHFSSPVGEVHVNRSDLSYAGAIGPVEGFVDMQKYVVLRVLLEGVQHSSRINYVNAPHCVSEDQEVL